MLMNPLALKSAASRICTTILLSCSGGFVFSQQPDARIQQSLTERGINYSEWLLYDGIYKRDPKQVAKALQTGADVNQARDYRGPYPAPSPLFAALYAGGQPEIVALLVESGANVNLRYVGTSSTNIEQLSPSQMLLLSAQERVADKRSKEYFPLYHAVETNAAAVETLLRAGADPRAIGGARSSAIFNTYDAEIGRLLVKYGADVNATNYVGETVLAHAKRQLRQLPNGHYLRSKVEAYCAWLTSVGAHE
jgi:hypothetical protein